MDDADRRWVESMPDAYEQCLVPTVFRPFAVDLAERVRRRGPDTVLELAAGTGVLTAEVLDLLPSATVVATDLNDAMVALGARRVPSAEWRTADAMDLPFGDGTFDAVLCQFGVMFFPDKPAALAQARRVLAPDGVVLLNAWGPVDAHDFQAAAVAVCDRLFPDDPPKFMRSVVHHYSDADALVADVAAAGLRVVELEQLVLEGVAPSAFEIASGYCLGTPLRSEIEARGGDLHGVTNKVAAEIETRLGAKGLSGRMQAHVLTASPLV